MDIQDKTREELISELRELREAYDALKVAVKSDLHGSEKTEQTLSIILNSVGDAVISTDDSGKVISMKPVADIAESYSAQKHLKESEERYGSLLGNLEAGIVVHAPDTSIVMNNQRASELLGLTDQQMRGKAAIDPAWKFIHENNTPLNLDEYPVNKVVSGRLPIKNQVLGIQQPSKNDVVWVTVNGFPVLNNKGEITEVVISFIDITERKQSELLLQGKKEEIEAQNVEYQQINEELTRKNIELAAANELVEKGEMQARDILQISMDGFWLVDQEGRFINANQVAFNMLGYSREEMLTMRISDVDIFATTEQIKKHLQKVIEIGEDRFETKHRCKNGTIIDVEVSVKIQASKNLMVVFVNNITERKIAEEKLKALEQQSRAWLDNSPACTKIVDLDFNLQFMSRAGIIGLKIDDITSYYGKPYPFHFYPESFKTKMTGNMNKAIETGAVITQEAPVVDINGNEIWFHSTIVPSKDDNGRIEYLIIVSLDITERKQAEDALRVSEINYQRLFETLSEGVSLNEIIYNDHGEMVDYRILEVNPAFYITAQYDGQVVGRLATDIYQMPVEYITAFWREHKDRNTVQFTEMISPVNGRYVLVATSPFLNDRFVTSFFDFTERKQAQEELKLAKEKAEENEAYLRSVLQSNNDIIVSRDLNNKVVFFNKAFENITMELFNQHAFVGMNTLKLLPKEEMLFWENVLQGVKNGENHEEEFRYKTTLKTADYITAHVPVVHGSKVVGTLEITKDITSFKHREDELKQSKEQAEESEEFFRSIFENSPVGKSITGLDGSLKTNKAFSDMLGYSFEEFQTKNLKDITHPDDIQKTVDAVETLLKGEESVINFEKKYIHKDGSIVYSDVVTTLQKNKNGEPLFFITSVNDITKRKLYEEKLNESLALLRIAGEKAKLGGWNVNLKENRSYWSDEVAAIHEMPAGFAPLVQDAINFYAPEWRERITKVFADCVHQGIPFDQEMEIITGGGKRVWINTIGEAVKDDNGNIFKVQGAFQDISGRKKAEEALIAAMEHAQESDRLKSAFLANMSHEIRTPMNGILGFAELLKEPDLTGDQQQEYIDIIGKSGKRMLNIINDIIDISKIESGLMKLDIKESNINEQVEYIYTFFKPEVEAKGMKLSFKNTLSAKEAIIKTDHGKVCSILTNLVKNAIKYTKEGFIEFGYNLIETDNCPSLRFYVKDTGIGIPKDRQDAIFERFIQSDIADKMARQGAGLGLSITKAYVEMLGGKIWVQSEAGIGSAFFFTLPYHAEAVKESLDQQLETSGKPDTIRKLNILIAEDDEASEMLIDLIVKIFGNEILKARTGTEAVESCRQNPDIDLVLMDIRMPEMGGYEATRQIREFNKDVVIIAQTAYGLAGDKEKSIEAGCNDYIAKPIVKGELHALIKKYFG
jgi:PAS domain S-box-containing protein